MGVGEEVTEGATVTVEGEGVVVGGMGTVEAAEGAGLERAPGG